MVDQSRNVMYRKHNGQNIMAKRKMAKVKTTIYKTKDRATGTPLKT
jgi:hypothetical protein